MSDPTEEGMTPTQKAFVVGLTFKVFMSVEELRQLWAETFADLEITAKGENVFSTKIEVMSDNPIDARVLAWGVVRQYISVSPISDEILSPLADKLSESGPPYLGPLESGPPETESTETTEPVIVWHVSLHCEIAFNPDVFATAWLTRLPNLVPVVDYEDSDERTTFFNVTIGVEAPNNVKACTMASGLLRRHFQTVKILEMTAERHKD